uniref:2-oxoisovalerate dehydrogenase subunit alpha n=1 Tax=Rhabditophanes sp. KR3021 TaxID=114890 RepID=A0AC35TWD8_9BILA
MLNLETNQNHMVEKGTYDSTAYRTAEEVKDCTSKDSPIERFAKYIIGKGYWSEGEDKAWTKEARQEVLKAFNTAEQINKPPSKTSW